MNRAWMGIATVAMLSGCLGPGAEQKPDVDGTKSNSGKAEAWGSADSPALFNSALEFRIAELPQSGQATNIPWASSYWPVYEDSINFKWDGAQSESASKKYERAFNLTGVEDAVSQYHGINAQSGRKECTQATDCSDLKDGSTCAKREGQEKGRCIPTWWGICHAWSPAAILTAEPKYPVVMNGVTFKVNDIKALVTLAHNSTNTKFVSLRCNKDEAADPATITYDEYGRPNDASKECRDTNPGTWHVLLSNYLGKQGASFVEDRTYDDEVWNQPLRGYNVTEQKEVSAAEANKLIGVTTVGGTTVNKAGSVQKAVWSHQGSFPVVAGQAIKVRMTGTGDADLHVKFGSQPTETAYDCRPYAGSSDETCELTVPAGATAAFVSVLGYADASTFSLAVTTGGMVPQNYTFNPNAVKFFSIKADVKYISEASSSTDGNLASTIDRYTHSDHYEYILEVDAAGKIIGGEWIGASKKAHPDFVWLPLSVGSTSVAGGKITYARVKELLDRSQTAPGGGGTTPTTDKVVNESGTVAKSAWKHYGPFNVAAGATLTATLTGDGDADLYVRKGAAPTLASYDCRPYQGTSSESCSLVGPGQVYVSVNGYAATSNFVLKVVYKEGSGTTPTPVDPPTSITHLNVSGTVGLGEQKHYELSVPAGAKLVVKTVAPNDVDLYIQMGAAPTPEAYLARGWTTSGNETINYTTTGNGTLHIMVHGYAASSFTLTTATAP